MSKRKRLNDSVAIIEEDDEERRYFLRPDAVSEHLYCSVCQEVFSEPQRAPCGHSYCKKCIYAWLKQSNTCPEDRKPVRRTDLHHDFILENIIGDQMVACPHRKHGCEHVGQLQMLSSHKKHCTFNPLNLPEFLKRDLAKNSSIEQSAAGSQADSEELISPVKPSLKLRLFSSGDKEKRQILCSMFNKENQQEIKESKRSSSSKKS